MLAQRSKKNFIFKLLYKLFTVVSPKLIIINLFVKAWTGFILGYFFRAAQSFFIIIFFLFLITVIGELIQYFIYLINNFSNSEHIFNKLVLMFKIIYIYLICIPIIFITLLFRDKQKIINFLLSLRIFIITSFKSFFSVLYSKRKQPALVMVFFFTTN